MFSQILKRTPHDRTAHWAIQSNHHTVWVQVLHRQVRTAVCFEKCTTQLWNTFSRVPIEPPDAHVSQVREAIKHDRRTDLFKPYNVDSKDDPRRKLRSIRSYSGTRPYRLLFVPSASLSNSLISSLVRYSNISSSLCCCVTSFRYGSRIPKSLCNTNLKLISSPLFSSFVVKNLQHEK